MTSCRFGLAHRPFSRLAIFSGVPHLCAMFTLFDKYKDHLKDRYATAFAIFFKRQATHFVELILSVDVTFRVQHGEPLAGFFCSCVQLILTFARLGS